MTFVWYFTFLTKNAYAEPFSLAGTIGTSILLGGAGFGLSKFFGGRKKQQKKSAADAARLREQALGIARQASKSQLGFPIGQDVERTLRERIAGRGVGFGPGFVDKTTAPFATGARRQFKQTTAPAITAEFSARGLGKATSLPSRLAIERGGVEQGINELIAGRELQAEQQRRLEINAALSSGQRFGEFETEAGRLAAQLELGALTGATGLNLQARQLDDLQRQRDVQNLLAVGQLGISGATLGAKVAGVGGFAPTSLFGGTTATPGVPTTGAGGGATVNVGGLDLSQSDIQILRQLLKGG